MITTKRIRIEKKKIFSSDEFVSLIPEQRFKSRRIYRNTGNVINAILSEDKELFKQSIKKLGRC